jgi:hypothetical protein
MTPDRLFSLCNSFALLGWCPGTRADFKLRLEKAIVIRIILETPDEFRSSVGAFTTPTERVHITVLFKRLEGIVSNTTSILPSD